MKAKANFLIRSRNRPNSFSFVPLRPCRRRPPDEAAECATRPVRLDFFEPPHWLSMEEGQLVLGELERGGTY